MMKQTMTGLFSTLSEEEMERLDRFLLDRFDEDTDTEGRNEGVLDVLSHAGVNVLWRDNNSGCKGACDRVETEQMDKVPLEGMCNEDGCFDEILLQGLSERIEAAKGDMLIVLHQKGSHGPTYRLRYPEEFNRFTPACQTNQLQDCTKEEIVNVYDNTILYTDYFLAKVIALLKEKSAEYDTAMLYLSDHGESLGENSLYLHGIPYMIAPEDQKRIPFIVWLSDGFEKGRSIDRDCLKKKSSEPISHDYLFHSLLGMMDVETHSYDPSLDIFAGCTDRPAVIAGAR